MIQDIELYTADGRLVETVRDPIVGMMGANGKPPEVLVWGERVFVLAAPDAYRPGAIRYREGMAWALRLGQEASAMPSPRVEVSPSGWIDTVLESLGDTQGRDRNRVETVIMAFLDVVTRDLKAKGISMVLGETSAHKSLCVACGQAIPPGQGNDSHVGSTRGKEDPEPLRGAQG